MSEWERPKHRYFGMRPLTWLVLIPMITLITLLNCENRWRSGQTHFGFPYNDAVVDSPPWISNWHDLLLNCGFGFAVLIAVGIVMERIQQRTANCETETTERPSRFQFHLSTAVVMMLLAGILLGICIHLDSKPIWLNLLVITVIFFDSFIRRREARKT